MKIVGVDLHAKQQSIATLDNQTGELTERMFGGLRHRNMKAKGRAIGWRQITERSKYPVEGAQCTCAAVIVCAKL